MENYVILNASHNIDESNFNSYGRWKVVMVLVPKSIINQTKIGLRDANPNTVDSGNQLTSSTIPSSLDDTQFQIGGSMIIRVHDKRMGHGCKVAAIKNGIVTVNLMKIFKLPEDSRSGWVTISKYFKLKKHVQWVMEDESVQRGKVVGPNDCIDRICVMIESGENQENLHDILANKCITVNLIDQKLINIDEKQCFWFLNPLIDMTKFAHLQKLSRDIKRMALRFNGNVKVTHPIRDIYWHKEILDLGIHGLVDKNTTTIDVSEYSRETIMAYEGYIYSAEITVNPIYMEDLLALALNMVLLN
uniref:DNA-directed RNA polymerase n=1 Tax=Rhabditophanes sp. KR3021 TaxID=114890 RepID=A0AC35UE48_9BILA